MKSGVIRDRRLRVIIQRQEPRRRALKFLQLEGALRGEELRRRFASLPRNGSRTRAKRYCRWTGRGRGVLRAWGRSRRRFKERASRGELAGIRPASW